MKYLIGIDESGRGPLAGPVSVGAVLVLKGNEKTLLTLMRDSKRLSAAAREELFTDLMRLKKQGALDFSYAFSSASVIDSRGIVPAIRGALSRCLSKLKADPSECEVLLDGSLSAPEKFVVQKTIIHGDASEPIISAASIVAKVMRDRYMVRIAGEYPSYGFEVHKGYGTLKHREAIRRRGLSGLHRASFCKSLHPAGNTV